MYNFKSLKWKLTVWLMLFLSFFNGVQVFAISAVNIYNEANIYSEINSLFSHDSALEEAIVLGEDISKRTENEKHFRMSDGSIIAVTYDEDVHYLKDGKYEEIDNSLTSENDEYGIKGSSTDIKFSKKAKENKILTIKNSDLKLTWGLKGITKSEGKVTNLNENLTQEEKLELNKKFEVATKTGIITYENVFANTDLRYTVLAKGVKEEIILKTKDSINNSFVFTADIKDVKAKLKEDNTIVFTKNGKEVFVIEAPYMYDANDNYSQEITLELNEVKNGYEITLIPDKEWLEDENRVFPVVIDPTITTTRNYQYISDTWIYSGDTNNNSRHTQHILRVGAKTTLSNDAHRTLVKFDLPELSAGDQVIDAQFRISNYHDTDEWTPPTETRQIDIHKMTKSWVDSTAHWKNLYTSFESEAADYFMYSYSSSNKNKTNTVDITKMVKEWYTTGNNYGLMLKEHNENITTQKQSIFFLSANTGTTYQSKRPVVYITYRNQTGIEGYLSYHTYNVGRAGTIYTNDYNGNLVLVHPDVATLGGVYPITVNHVYNVNDKTVNLGYGNGFRLNLLQTLEEMTISGIDYVKFVDEDGTAHYFYKDGDKYYDEDGMGLTLTKTNNIYYMKDKSGNENKFELYDTKWRLTELKNAAKQNVVITYTGNIITKVTDYTEQEILFTYTNNKLSSITDPTGRIWNYSYIGDNLTSITYPDNETITYSYSDNLLIDAKNIDNSKLNIEYYSANPNRVKKVSEYATDGTLGTYMTIEYATNSTKFIDSQNNILYYNFTNLGNVSSVADYGTSIDLKEAYGRSIYYGREESNKNKPILSHTASQPIINLLKDASIEREENIWQQENLASIQATLTKDSNISLYGSKSLKIKSENVNTNARWYQTVNSLEDNKDYTFSGYLKTDNLISENSGAYLTISYVDTNNQVVKKESSKITGSKNWQRVYVSIKLPTGVTSVNVSIEMKNSTGILYADALQLETGTTANLFNVVENGDFTYSTTYWGTSSMGSSDGIITTNNTKAFKINADANTRKNIYQTLNLSGKAGDSYTFGCWVKNNGAKNYGNRNCELTVAFIKENGDITWLGVHANPDSNEWQNISMYVTADSDYTQIKLFFVDYNNINHAEITNIYGYRGGDKQIYSYDKNGNLLTTANEKDDINANAYDAANRLINIKSASNTTMSYEYDMEVQNRLTKAVDNYLDLNYEFEYDWYGNLTKSSMTIDDATSIISSGKTYYIENSGSNKYIDDYARTQTENNNRYFQNSFTGLNGQRFLVELAEDGLYTIKTNNGTNKYFTIDQNNNLIMADYTGNYNQKFIFQKLADDSYYIMSVYNGYVLELETDKPDKGVGFVAKNEFENKELQRFKFKEHNIDKTYMKYGLESNEVYRIRIKSSNLYLDHDGSATTDYLVQNELDESKKSQLFRVVRVNENNYKIVPYDSPSGKAIGTNGANSVNSNAIISEYSDTYQHQIWEINLVGDRLFTIKSTQANNYMLGLETAVTTNNTKLVLNSVTDTDKQKFYFEKVGIFDIHEQDFYELRLNGSVLTNDGNDNVILSDEDVCYWSFKNLNNGYYIIENVFSGNVMAVDENGSDLILTTKDETYTDINQQFELVANDNESIKIKPRIYEGKMALHGNYDENGAHLSLENSENYHNQNAYFDVMLWFKGNISRTNQYTWDGKYLASTTDEFGNTISYNYNTNGDLTSAVDRRGNTVTYSYDLMKRMTSITKGNLTLNYTYTKDKLTNINVNEVNYNFVYDKFNNVSSILVANRPYITNIYGENNGNVTSVLYGNNQSVGYEYDRFNRINKVINADNTYIYHYDKKGNVSYVEDNYGRKDYQYDLINRLISFRYNEYLVEYEYDASGNVAKKTQFMNNDKKETEYSYDKAGRLNNVKLDDMLTMYNYDKYSRLSSTVLKSGYNERKTTYYYQNVSGMMYSNRIQEVVDNGKRVWYNYDENGNIIEVLENDETIYEYEYDALDRLILEHDKILDKTIQYIYDNNNNILLKIEYAYKTDTILREVNYVYDSIWKDLLVSYNGKTIITDSIGNVTNYDGKTYTWIDGRTLLGITDSSNQITYKYNDTGIRTSKTVNNITTEYQIDSNGKVAYEKNGETIIYYIYDGNQDLIGFEYEGQKYYYLKNLQDDIIGILDSDLNVAVNYLYDSWGNLISLTDSNGVNITNQNHIGYLNPYRYRSYRYDNETGLYYLNSRYYNPEWGRYINADIVISNVGSLDNYNLFAYCSNNPVNNVDENGRDWAGFKKKVANLWNGFISTVSKLFGTETQASQTTKEKELSLGLIWAEKGVQYNVDSNQYNKNAKKPIMGYSKSENFRSVSIGMKVTTKNAFSDIEIVTEGVMPIVNITLGGIVDDVEHGYGIHINLKTFSMGIHKTETIQTADGSLTGYFKTDTSLILLPVCILAAPLIVDNIPVIITSGSSSGILIPALQN